jgi:ribose-phosphate pyrophosphokinase
MVGDTSLAPAACVVPGTANRALAVAVADRLGVERAACDVERFPDGELRPVVEGVRGRDVYIVQPTGPPVNEHLVELLLLLDACRRAGAARVTAVVPYFGYARQDRRLREGEAVGVRVCADALAGAGADRLVVVDPHTAALEAMCAVPVEMLTAMPVLTAAAADLVPAEAVVVAADLGAVKLAERYAAAGRAVAVVRKVRVSGRAVHASELIGDVSGRPAVVVDDMVTTGATVEAAVRVLEAHGATGVTVAATHGVLIEGAAERIAAAGVSHLLLTDTLAPPPGSTPAQSAAGLRVCSVAPLLAEAIGRLHRGEALGELRLTV